MKKDIHGGNLSEILHDLNLPLDTQIKYDFSVNLNPLGFPYQLEKKIYSNLDKLIINYPEIFATCAEQTIAEYEMVNCENIIVGNGATEIFDLIFYALKPKKVLIPTPTYSGYCEACEKYNSLITYADKFYFNENFNDLNRLIIKNNIDLVILGNPNNPTGKLLSKNIILDFIKKSNAFFIIDESFIDWTDKKETLLSYKPIENLIVVKSLTKFYSIAGLRVGFGYSSKKMIEKMRSVQINWSMNAFAQVAVQNLYDVDFIKISIENMKVLRESFNKKLALIPYLKIFKSDANFILCKLINTNENSLTLQKKLILNNIFIRSCADVNGLDNSYFRLAIKSENDNNKFICSLRKILNLEKEQYIEKRAKAIMVVGTASNSGKSVITAGICRLLKNRGYSVAPFKAQNMSLNSFVTKDGGEIGRAQVMQAKAACIEPHTDMNPVLLKPLGNSTSQVIINGKAIGNYSAVNYYKMKLKIRQYAFDAYDRLAQKYDYIILEGAGSPTEINLLNEDFVNMRMAEYANAKTILVADIDRGGMFAAIFGTIKLLPRKWQKLFKGIIINKFRGDISLLDSGIKDIEKLVNIPVLGIIKHIENINIEEEDSLALEEKKNFVEQSNKLSIAIIKLPRMSNWTDFMTIENSKSINISYVSNPRKLGNPDCIIIPGTKNVISDMKFLRESGFEIKLNNLRNMQIPIIGICGGYQILGEIIKDPKGIEGDMKMIKGLGFLKIETTLEEEKELAQVAGSTNKNYPFAQVATKFNGYEIHCGKTKMLKNNVKCLDCKNNKQVDCLSADKLVFGTYIHGLFDTDKMLSELISYLTKKTGKSFYQENSKPEDPYDKIANLLSTFIHF